MLTLEIPNTVTDIATLRRNIVAVASRELQRWNDAGRRTETDPRMLATLADYWKNGAGANFTQAQLASPAFQQGHPWSAAFISWVMKSRRRPPFAMRRIRFTFTPPSKIVANSSNPARRCTRRIHSGESVCKSATIAARPTTNIRGMAALRRRRQHAPADQRHRRLSTTPFRERRCTDANGRITVPGYFAIIKVGAAAAPRPCCSDTDSRPAPPNITPANPSEIGRTLYAPRSAWPAPKQTGIFCPARYGRASADLVVYFHGIRTSADRHLLTPAEPHFALREDLHARQTRCSSPLLGVPGSDGTPQAGGFDRFLDAVLQSIQQNGWITGPARVGNIIFACHSGGGLSMRTIALANNNAASQIRECWGFDCTYNGNDYVVWPRWAAKMPNSQLRLYYLKGTQTQYQAKEIEKLRVPNITVNVSNARGHNFVPRAHFLELLRASTVLRHV